MRIAAFIIGLIGAAGALFLGAKWNSDMHSELGKAAEALAAGLGGGMGAELNGFRNAIYALFACGAIGLIASVVVLLRKGQPVVNGLLLIACAVAPIVFMNKAVLGVPMALAGIFAFFVRRPSVAAGAAF
jgi:hypothetical protein